MLRVPWLKVDSSSSRARGGGQVLGTHGVTTKEVQDWKGKFPVAWGQWHWISLRSAP